MGELDTENDTLEQEVESELETETDAEVSEVEADGEGEEDEREDDAGEGEEDEGDNELGQRAQKRIQKLNGQKKDLAKQVEKLTSELEEARKSGGEDGATYLAAAKAAGVLPSLLTKELAEAIKTRGRNREAIDFYEDFLDGDDETITIGDQELTRKDVRRRLRNLRTENDDLDRRFGSKEREVQKQARDIFALGQAAMKAGWKPGKKAIAKTTTTTSPGKGATLKPAQKGSAKEIDWNSVESAEDAELMIMRMNQKD